MCAWAGMGMYTCSGSLIYHILGLCCVCHYLSPHVSDAPRNGFFCAFAVAAVRRDSLHPLEWRSPGDISLFQFAAKPPKSYGGVG